MGFYLFRSCNIKITININLTYTAIPQHKTIVLISIEILF